MFNTKEAAAMYLAAHGFVYAPETGTYRRGPESFVVRRCLDQWIVASL